MKKFAKIKINVVLATLVLCGMSSSVVAEETSEHWSFGNRMNYTVPINNAAENLKVGTPCFSYAEKLSSNWITAFKSAINELNNSGANIHLTWVNSCDNSKQNDGFDISVYEYQYQWNGSPWEKSSTKTDNVVMQAAPGSSDGVGVYTILNPEYNPKFWDSMSHKVKVNLALHELMHNLGMLHSYTNDGISTINNSGDIYNDNESSVVKRVVDVNAPKDRLSFFDKIALKKIYQ